MNPAAIFFLDFAACNTYALSMANDTPQDDPFRGLGTALKQLRKRAGFKTQLLAAEALGIDKGQLSRWENEIPRPTLENLGRLLAGYGATVADLAAALGVSAAAPAAAEMPGEEGPSAEELIRSLAEALRRVEGRQMETEGRVERIERGLEAAAPARALRAGEG